jgi:phosphatidylserine decarboxylase
MSGGWRRKLSGLVGWAADRRIPTFLRAPVYKTYARFTGANLDELRLPLAAFPSLGAFFVRELREGVRPLAGDANTLVSPVDGTIQSLCPVERGSVLQAKGRAYSLDELLAGVGRASELEGGFAWTIYLSPRDYHRIHSPLDARLSAAAWVGGARFSVAPKVVAARRVFEVNERVVLRLEHERATFFLVLVGAFNVGRMRVVGVDPRQLEALGQLSTPKHFARGAELARFEMGSTIILIAPRAVIEPESALAEGQSIRLGAAIGRFRS